MNNRRDEQSGRQQFGRHNEQYEDERYRERGMAGRGQDDWRSDSLTRSDERIREDVCQILTNHHDVDASDIEVEVKGGEVTLSGTVIDRWTKRLAEAVVENVSGIADIHNRLRVAPIDAKVNQPSAPASQGRSNGNQAPHSH